MPAFTISTDIYDHPPAADELYEFQIGDQSYLVSKKQHLVATAHEDMPDVRVVLVLGGKQTGKTEAVALAMMRQIIQHPMDEFLIVAPDYKKLDDSTLKKFVELCDLIPGFIIPSSQKSRKHSTEQKAKIVTYNDSVVYYRSTDRYSTFEGMTLRAAWVDEVQHIPQEVVEEIRWNRLTIKQGILYLSGAYLRPEQWANHWLEEYRRAALSGSKEILLVEFCPYDLRGLKDRRSGRPLFNEDEIERKKKHMPRKVFESEVLGLASSAVKDDRIYPAEEINKAVQRWPERFSTLPRRLYEYLAERMRQRGCDPPPKSDHEDQIGSLVVGVDVAEYGGDSICVSFRSGRTVYWLENWGGMSIPQLERDLAQLYHELEDVANGEFSVMFVVDEGGLGKGVPSHLIEMGVDARGLSYHEATSDPVYTSIKAELYFRLKEWLTDEERPLALPPVEALLKQMATIRYEITGDKRKIAVVKPKDSPDELDSVVLGIIAGDDVLPVYFPEEHGVAIH